MDNPFTPSRVATGESFCNRRKELNILAQRARIFTIINMRLICDYAARSIRVSILHGVCRTSRQHQEQPDRHLSGPPIGSS